MKDGKKVKKQVGTGKMMSEVDETPWCGCFVAWCLAQAGVTERGHATAADWVDKKYGSEEPIDKPRVGSIVVVSHPVNKAIAATTTSGNHVAFYIGGPPDAPVLLGGNQGDMVSRKQFNWTVKGYRWPSSWKGASGK